VISTPLLSEIDLSTTGEGSIDPLGLIKRGMQAFSEKPVVHKEFPKN
jgi:hypothetical protein